MFEKTNALELFRFNFALAYVIRVVQADQEGFKLNGTHQLLVYTYHGNIRGESNHTVKIKAERLLVASNEIGL
jgi:hypothetical protein